MINNSPSIVEESREQLEQLLEMVNQRAESESSTADQVERDLYGGVLELGRHLLQLYFTQSSVLEEKQSSVEKAGESYQAAGQPKRKYRSVFGEVEAQRYYYWKAGSSGVHPLDADWSLPEQIHSHWVQELVAKGSTEMPYEKALERIKELLPVEMSKGTAEQLTVSHAAQVEAYYDQIPTPKAVEGDTILVATADGKGIPMISKDSPPPEKRREKGRKTAKKTATVVAAYTIAPYYRDPEVLIRSLLKPDSQISDPTARPVPHHKHIFATLEGQPTAFTHLEKVLTQRDTDQIVHRVALTDGDHGLHQRVATQLPDFTLILDIMHVLGYLWEAVNVLLGATHPGRHSWMEDALRCLLDDDLDTLSHHLNHQLESGDWSPSQAQTLRSVIGYLQNNRASMYYQSYLAQGFPIGTGVVEGTCRYFVHDRFERSGMRWSYAGAEAMLQLRAVSLNNDWDDFHHFRRLQTHQQLYGNSHPALLPEMAALTIAA